MINAWIRIAVVDAMTAMGGFQKLHRFVKGINVRSRRSRIAPEQLCKSLDRAAAHYPRELHCLKRSAAMTWLLRARGYPATMTIGTCVTPFLAHAWVEVDGRVVSDDEQRIRSTYAVLERC